MEQGYSQMGDSKVALLTPRPVIPTIWPKSNCCCECYLHVQPTIKHCDSCVPSNVQLDTANDILHWRWSKVISHRCSL